MGSQRLLLGTKACPLKSLGPYSFFPPFTSRGSWEIGLFYAVQGSSIFPFFLPRPLFSLLFFSCHGVPVFAIWSRPFLKSPYGFSFSTFAAFFNTFLLQF